MLATFHFVLCHGEHFVVLFINQYIDFDSEIESLLVSSTKITCIFKLL